MLVFWRTPLLKIAYTEKISAGGTILHRHLPGRTCQISHGELEGAWAEAKFGQQSRIIDELHARDEQIVERRCRVYLLVYKHRGGQDLEIRD